MAKGIDVTVIHPSPVASNFYNNLAKIDALEMARKSAVSADTLPDVIFQSIGWFVQRDVGSMAMIVRTVRHYGANANASASASAKNTTLALTLTLTMMPKFGRSWHVFRTIS